MTLLTQDFQDSLDSDFKVDKDVDFGWDDVSDEAEGSVASTLF